MRRRTWTVAGAVTLVAVAAISGLATMSGGGHAGATAQASPVNTGTRRGASG